MRQEIEKKLSSRRDLNPQSSDKSGKPPKRMTLQTQVFNYAFCPDSEAIPVSPRGLFASLTTEPCLGFKIFLTLANCRFWYHIGGFEGGHVLHP